MKTAHHLCVSLFCNVLLAAIMVPLPRAQSSNSSRIEIRIVTDEADAVLAILAKKKTTEPISDSDWQPLFASEGYVRLKKRETELKRKFEDQDFKSFVLSDALAGRAQALQETLNAWKRADLTAAAQRALAYLPNQASIRAKIYPVIKPQENSFVFEVTRDPAIFLYIDPGVSKEKFENTLAHELHHIGYGGSCPSKQVSRQMLKLPRNVRSAVEWIGAFGEGFAMFAAAGGPDAHPHAASNPEDRARWDHDIANFNDDLKRVERFFLDLIDSKLSEEQTREVAYSFFGIQGPWYTVGWKMAVTIERAQGRAKLIESFCDQSKLLLAYNDAAALYNRTAREKLVLWSPMLLDRIRYESR